jgi:pimeloyl-ACP methyl ester carboxylesterase
VSFALEPRHRTGSGEPLVLLHGFTNTWRVWLPVLPALERRFDVLVPTLGGHCGADPWEDGVEPTVSALADIAERELDAAGFDTAHVAGNSLGGWIALELAKRGRARSVVALSPAGGWTGDDPREERRLKGFFARTRKLSELSYPLARKLVTRPRLRQLMLRDAMEHGDRMKPGDALHMVQGVVECSIFFEFMEAVLRDGPAVELEQISCPALIAWAEKDKIFPIERYEETFRTVPGVEVVRLNGCGHVPMWDDPELVARTIGDFAAAGTLEASPGAVSSQPSVSA